MDALLGGIKAQVDSWRPGVVVDMAREMDALANALISTALFSSVKVTGDADTIRDTIADFIAGVGVRSVVPSDLVDKLSTPANRRFIRARDRLEKALASIINRYQTDPQDHGQG
ncbi:hypothetical protein ACH4GE_11410 [Streptomyces tendae]|uniref:hypothetical protein n=1 Tax=Streptomyces tendae TaxID=1932 RepID=UPI0037AA2737